MQECSFTSNNKIIQTVVESTCLIFPIAPIRQFVFSEVFAIHRTTRININPNDYYNPVIDYYNPIIDYYNPVIDYYNLLLRFGPCLNQLGLILI